MARKGENIFKRKDGRWEARYIKEHKNGKAIYGFVFGKSYSEAKEKKTAALAVLMAKPKLSGAQTTMKEIGSQWLTELEPICKASTIAKYGNQLELHIIPYFGDKYIHEITNEDMITFRNRLLTKKNLSLKSTSDILSRIKSIRRFALIHGYEINFVPECMAIPQKTEKIRVLTFSEEMSLLEYLRIHPNLTNLGILLCLFTGIRIGELCALMWNDISLDARELHIRRTMQRIQNRDKNAAHKTYINIDQPKSQCSIRTIPIPSNIMDSLQSAYSKDAYLLTGHSRLFVEPRTMENRFKTILKNCGIRNASFHVCRHTFATRCVEAGFDVKSLSEILGHANVNITLNRYVHPTMELKHENMKKLSKLFEVK